MAWEKRKGKFYYYSKSRIGGRVSSRYIGTGEMASLYSEFDNHKCVVNEIERESIRRMINQHKAFEKEIDDVSKMIETIFTASLLANGWHQHKREWRRKRNVKKYRNQS